MDLIPKIPGKTAPRVIADLKLHDPTAIDAHNPFREPPTSYLTGNFRPGVNNAQRCEHIFTTKLDQTFETEPVNGYPPKPLKKVSGICQSCRWHIEISIDNHGDQAHRCPKTDWPLHFFVLSYPPRIEREKRRQETYIFSCTGCSAKLEVVYRPPRLEVAYFDLLINPENLHDRFVRAVRQDPERQTLQEQPGIKVLEALSSYLLESLRPTRADASVPADNKRFMTSFGSDCDTLLQWLGFRKKDAVVQEGLPLEPAIWYLPKAPPCDPFSESSRNILEDVMEELHAKIRQYSSHEQKTLKHPPPYPAPLAKSLEVVLGCKDYPQADSRFRKPDFGVDEFYSGLGAMPDFSDSLLEFCFRQQVANYPQSSAYFFDCLSGIAQKRNTEELSMAVAMLASEGYVTQEEVLQAYRYLGFRADAALTISDDQVLGSFNSRLENSPRHQESDLREKLRIIGRARGSSDLVSAADNDIKTPVQALKWLDATYDGSVQISDEHIIALAASKLSDHPEQAENCKKAVELIAAERNSEMLRVWAREGATSGDAKEEAIAAAYRFFDINDRTQEIDLDILLLYTTQYEDDAVKSAEAARHYNVILESMNDKDMPVGAAVYDRPVGLENMGNTCYLNCLLQFLYTIKPVRDLILNFDDFKLDTTDPAFVPKQVDSLMVPKTETIHSQQFVNELRVLFREMATDPRSAVRPTWDLAKLALIRSAMPAAVRRSTIGGDIPYLKSPLRATAPPLPEINILGSSPLRRTANSSEVTLIDSVTKTPDDDDDSGMIVDEKDGPDTPVQTDSPIELSADPMDSDTEPLLGPLGTVTPPSRPPPVPPRPAIGPMNRPDAEKSGWKDESSKREAEQAAQQQDVEEAMSNVLFKLQCSIKNTEPTASGSLTDKVSQLFYGNYLWKYLDTKTEDNNELFSTINISLLQKPKTISSGLDSCFSVDEVMLEGKQTRRYRTITSIPPIFQVYLQRQEFDPNRQDTVIVKHHIQLEEVIYMDRFMTLKDKGLHELRERAWKLDSRLSALQESQNRLLTTSTGLESPELLDTTWQFIDTHGELINPDDPSLVEDLKAEASARRARASATTGRIKELEGKREALFANYRKHAYRLAAVFVHRGQGGSMGGHYWIYIYDFKESKWRRYEDREVRDVVNPQEEIFSPKDPEVQGAPYFVVYVQDEKKDDIVDALCRVQPVEELTEPQDEEMQDGGLYVHQEEHMAE